MPKPDTPLAYLRLRCGGKELVLALAEVREILRLGKLTPVPGTPPFVCGVMNLRGTVVPVLDLATRLGLGQVEAGPRNAIVVVELPDAEAPFRVGLLVDAVSKLQELRATQLNEAPQLGCGIEREFLSAMIGTDASCTPIINLSTVLAPTAISALVEQHCQGVA